MANANVNLNGAAGAPAFDDPNIWGPDPNNDPNNWVNPDLVEPGFQLFDLLNAGGQGAGGHAAGGGGHAAGGGPLAVREPPVADRKRD